MPGAAYWQESATEHTQGVRLERWIRARCEPAVPLFERFTEGAARTVSVEQRQPGFRRVARARAVSDRPYEG